MHTVGELLVGEYISHSKGLSPSYDQNNIETFVDVRYGQVC